MPNDDQQFIEFVQRKKAWLHRLAVCLCGDWQLAEEFVQDALVKLYQHWPRLRRRDVGALCSFVRTTLVRLIIDEARRPCRKSERHLAELPVVAVCDPDAAEAVVVRRALRNLPEKQRTAVVCCVMFDFPAAETAKILGCRPETVRSHVSRGVERLRAILGEALQDPQPIGVKHEQSS